MIIGLTLLRLGYNEPNGKEIKAIIKIFLL